MTDAIDPTSTPPPYRWAAATFVIVLVLYVVTLSPTTAMWDASEYISAAKVLGIPHPPGNPLFTLMAHVWGLLPFAAEYARRINLFAATTSAAGAALWFLVAERWLRSILPARRQRLIAAFAGIFASATAWTVWNQSTVNEKVYTVSMLSIALVAWMVVRWADEPPTARRDRWLIGAAYIIALSSTNHPMGVLGAPLLLAYVVLTDWRVLVRPRVLLAAAGAVLVGVSLNYLYLPIRAAQFPAINEGEPTGFFSSRLHDVLSRAQFGKPPLLPRQPWAPGEYPANLSHFGAQLAMYWQYWTWQWGRDLGRAGALVTAAFTALGLGGLVTLIRRDRRAGLAALVLAGTLTLALVVYLNFRFGYSYHALDPAITPDLREVRERDYFFVASFAFAGVLIAAGFAALLRMAESQRNVGRRWAVPLAVAAVAVIALLPMVGNRRSAPREGETLARDYAIDMLQSVEPYGILITAGDNDTFPLWYAQQVLGVRRDVTLANLSLMSTDWHVRQLQRQETPVFDPTHAAALWKPETDVATQPLDEPAPGMPRRPTSPVFRESLNALDSIGNVLVAPGTGMTAGTLTLRFGRDTLMRSDLVTALLIHDNIGKRPIYFAVTAANMPDQVLGLHNHLVMQGMVRKLVTDSVKAGGEIADSQYLGFVDVARMRRLLFETYHTDTATRKRPGGWYDPPSANILGIYLRMYGAFADVLQQRGDSADASRSLAIARQVRQAIRGEY
ncbi:MAG: glycosyltransferase family 117 protein [Gemmatimonadales bacterium]